MLRVTTVYEGETYVYDEDKQECELFIESGDNDFCEKCQFARFEFLEKLCGGWVKEVPPAKTELMYFGETRNDGD